jgi:hypothetical protein
VNDGPGRQAEDDDRADLGLVGPAGTVVPLIVG